ncbi:MAG: hypothetical protein Q8906_10385 [Bacillota bacterium]|nr:hypothetical protein [Bacillota bacterium]
MKTMKHWAVIMLAGSLLFGCSAKTAVKEKKESTKSEQTQSANTKQEGSSTDKSNSGNNTAVANASDGDTRFANGLATCSPLFTQTNDLFSQSAKVDGDKTTYDYQIVKDGIAKSKEATKCVDTKMADLGLGVPVTYVKTLQKFASTTSELLSVQKSMETFLQSKKEDDYSNAIEHLMNMMTGLSETSAIFQQEQK